MNRIKDLFKGSFNIPNAISFLRILLIGPCVISLLRNDYLMAAIYFILSGLSDALDGFLARKLNQITPLGQILDPLADKLTLGAIVICISIKVPELIPVAIILVLKDFIMLLAGTNLLKKNIMPPPAKWYGKLSTVLFYISVIIILGLKAIWEIDIPWLTGILFGITIFMMIFSLIKYFIIYREILKKFQNNF